MEPDVNLRDLRDEINSGLDYNPDLKQYDDNLTRVINRHYLQVSSQYQWLFMHKRALLMLRADIAGSSTDTLTADGSHVVTLPTTLGAGIKNLPADIVGHTLVINNATFQITRQHDAREFVVDQQVPPGTYTSWTIEYISYPMPRDSVEVLGVMDRGITTTETASFGTDSTTVTLTAPNRGRFMFLDARKEENLYLDRVNTGDPFVSVEEMHANLPPPDFAPILILREEEAGRSTSVVRNAIYEYCYTFLYAGMESPPSPVASLDTTTDETDSIVILIKGLMDTSAKLAPGGLSNTGRVKKIYRRFARDNISDVPTSRLVSGMGPWRHIATVKESTTSFEDDAGELIDKTVVGETSYDGYVDPSGELFRVDRLNEIGPRQYLRFWNTPNSDYFVEARYHRRPFRLVNDADAPEWPVQYHHYLVYAALKDICMQHGMTSNSQLYDGRAKELLERMKSKYLSRTDRIHIRRGFDRAMADRERFGVPSKT
tara:strand:+ start:151 stop:1611 length:1461 start_codon:yes stop_codon:yes gene_type:complete